MKERVVDVDIRISERDYSVMHIGAYGDLKVIASYVGLSKIPKYTTGELPHGWIIKERNIIPDFVIGSDGLGYKRKRNRLFVARKDQESYLREEGFADVHAIGHPIVYLDNRDQSRRIKNSLLIMPAHSLSETTEDWVKSDNDYCEVLKKHLSKFDFIALCLHPVDIKKGNWEKLTNLIPNIVEGADPKDHNSYYRQRDLFSTFEFVTGNSFGSHIAYASYFGAKVSIFGPKPKFRKDDYSDLVYYRNQPKILDIIDLWDNNNYLELCYPDFHIEPDMAVNRVEWAEKELGSDCKKSSSELRLLLSWNRRAQFKIFLKSVVFRILKKTKSNVLKTRDVIRSIINIISYFGLYSGIRNIYTIYINNKSKELSLYHKNKQIFIRANTSDIEVCKQHFGRLELQVIKYPKKVQTILDLGSNVGISVFVFRDMFPDAKIIAVEMNLGNFELLNKNTLGDSNIELVNGAIWSETAWIDQVDPGDGNWGIRVGQHTGKFLGKVPAYTYSQLLEMHDLIQVDVCKMDIEGSEKDVLKSSWRDIFNVTKLLIVEVHDWIPGCKDTVDEVLEKAKNEYDLLVTKSGEFTLIEIKNKE